MPTSPNSLENGNVEVLGFRTVEPKQQVVPVQNMDSVIQAIRDEHQRTIDAITQVSQQTATHAVQSALNASNTSIIGVLHAISAILAVRLILLLSIAGSFALAVMAMQSQTNQAIGLLVSFVALTVLPLVWLDRNGKRKSDS